MDSSSKNPGKKHVSAGVSPSEPATPDWDPVDCKGNYKDNCDVLRAWGLAWQAWGEEVRVALKALPDSTGGPTNVSPPPPPPYKP